LLGVFAQVLSRHKRFKVLNFTGIPLPKGSAEEAKFYISPDVLLFHQNATTPVQQ